MPDSISRREKEMIIKSILCTIFILTFAAICSAQSNQPTTDIFEPPTKLEKFEARTGTIIVKNYTEVGSVSGYGGAVSATSYEFVDAQSGLKEYGLGIEIRDSRPSEREERLYLDYDEIDSLIKAIDHMIKIDKSETLENFEAQYKTRGGLAVNTFNRNSGALRAAISSDLTRRTRVGMTLGNFADFRKLIVDAKTVLDKIK